MPSARLLASAGSACRPCYEAGGAAGITLTKLPRAVAVTASQPTVTQQLASRGNGVA